MVEFQVIQDVKDAILNLNNKTMEKNKEKELLIEIMEDDAKLGLYDEPKQENCCTPIGQIKRYVDCIGCDRKPKQLTDLEIAIKLEEIDKENLEQETYSEEDMRSAYNFGMFAVTTGRTFTDWFKTYKKK